MRQQEINFKCNECGHVIDYYQQGKCVICHMTITWEETIELKYQEKYLEIYTGYV